MDVNKFNLPQARKEVVDVIGSLHLVNKQRDVLHELLRGIIMENVHIHHLAATGEERRTIFLLLNKCPDSRQNQSTGVYSFYITTWCLESNRKDRGHH